MSCGRVDRRDQRSSKIERGRGGRTALKDLGTPKGSKEKVQVYDGPYGLYVFVCSPMAMGELATRLKR